MRKIVIFITLLGCLQIMWSQAYSQLPAGAYSDPNGKMCSSNTCGCCLGDWLKRNDGNLYVGFTNWNYAQTDKNAISTLNPWQLYNMLSLDAGYENNYFYAYFLYTFNDNSVGQWLGYKFRIGNEKDDDGNLVKKWDVYAVFTEYPSGALPYAGIGLEHTWDIKGPLSVSYFVEAGARDYLTTWSTGFMINLQQGILKKPKK